jgi:hypothetical protein
MSVMYCYMTLLVTLLPSRSWKINEISREANLRGNTGSFNEAIIETQEFALDEHVWSRCTREFGQTRAIGASPIFLQRLISTVEFVQPVLDMWNVVLDEVRHEHQIFSTSTC